MLLRYLFFISVVLISCQSSERNKMPEVLEEPGGAYDTLAFRSKSKQVDAFFHKLRNNYQFNGAVLVARGGRILYKNAFGWNDIRRRKDSLRTGDDFELASVSKQFTAAGVLKLVQDGKISLDDTVQRFYPDFPYKGITIRMLLTHRGGLTNYTYFCDQVCDRRKVVSNQEMVELLIQHKPAPYFLPDRRHDYSNTGYALLAAIIEKVSGKSYKQYMEEEIFIPAGMKHTYVYDVKQTDAFAHATGHKAYGERTYPSYLEGVLGDKGVYSNVEDLFRWDRALYSEYILEKTLIDSAFVPGNKELKKPFNYGFGWRTYTFDDGRKLVYHGGWWNGFKSYFLRDLESENTVIILANCENRGFGNLDELFDILYDRKPSSLRKFSARIHHSPGF
jgi:CubicO group peptidase (beta-lactamase class C family)